MAMLRKSKPETTPDRQALAVAIAEHRAVLAEAEAADKAATIARRQTETHRRDMAKAQEALDASGEAGVAFMLAQAQGEAAERPMTAPDARIALETAKAHLDAAKAAEAELARRSAYLPNALVFQRDKVAKAAAQVVASVPDTDKLLAEFQRLQRQLLETGHAIVWLAEIGAVSVQNVMTDTVSDFSPAKRAMMALEQPPGYWKIDPPPGRTASFERLAVFYDALQRDADAVFQE